MPIETRLKPFALPLLVLGLVANPWVVGYLLTTDGTIDDYAKGAAVIFVDALLVLTAVTLLVPAVRRLLAHKLPTPRDAGLVIVGLALFSGATYWGLSVYTDAHRHTVLESTDSAAGDPAELAWAQDFERRTIEAAIRHNWFDFDNAMALGWQVDTVSRDHYPNPEHMFDDRILDPDRPEWLIFHDTPSGGKILMAVMYYTRALEEVGPNPGGEFALWHWHPLNTPKCAIKGLLWTAKPDRDGNCAEGEPVDRTPEMMHVWFVEHPLGAYTEHMIATEGSHRAKDGLFEVSLMHPILVHFTIALFLISVLLDIVGRVKKSERLQSAAWINLAFAFVFSVATVAAGMAAEAGLKVSAEMHTALDLHKYFAFTVFGIIVVLAFWRWLQDGKVPRRGAGIYLSLSVVGAVLIGVAGYYGGAMVYEHGANVRAIDDWALQRYTKRILPMYRSLAEGAAIDAASAARSPLRPQGAALEVSVESAPRSAAQ